jgi:hypothetical protein
MTSIPMFVLGQGQTSLPLLTAEQAKASAQIILLDEVRRSESPARGGHPKSPIAGQFVSYTGKCSWHRGSDRVERIYAAVEFLKRSGLTDKEATSEVAEVLGTSIGNSKRGRPALGTVPQDLVRRAQVVRSLHNHFEKRHPWNEALSEHDPIVEKWFMYAVFLASWSEPFSRINESFFKEPKLQAIRSIVETISMCAKYLRGLYAEYPVWRNLARKGSVLVVPSHSAPALPNGWYPTGCLSTKTD